MNSYPCELIEVFSSPFPHAKVRMMGPHAVLGERAQGQEIRTSELRSIDFERGFCVTQNSIYVWRRS